MKLKDLIRENQIIFDLTATTKEEAIKQMVNCFGEDILSDKQQYMSDVIQREQVCHTQLDGVMLYISCKKVNL